MASGDWNRMAVMLLCVFTNLYICAVVISCVVLAFDGISSFLLYSCICAALTWAVFAYCAKPPITNHSLAF